MAESWREDARLPAQARQALAIYVEGLSKVLGDRLRAVLLYGSVAHGDVYHAPSTPVETLVVIDRADAPTLITLGPALHAAQKKARVRTMIVTPEDLAGSTDVFPSKFIDMQERHVLLHGQDPLEGLEICRDHLRLRCEQELRNLLLRLRNLAVRHAGKEGLLRKDLSDMGGALIDQLRHLLRLRKDAAPASRAEVVEAVGQLDLDPKPLEELLALGRGRYVPKGDALRGLLDRTLQVAAAACAQADSHSHQGGGGDAA